jgi:hypothetical protein
MGHHHVEQYEVGRCLCRKPQRRGSVGSLDKPIVSRIEEFAKRLPVCCDIVDDEDDGGLVHV